MLGPQLFIFFLSGEKTFLESVQDFLKSGSSNNEGVFCNNKSNHSKQIKKTQSFFDFSLFPIACMFTEKPAYEHFPTSLPCLHGIGMVTKNGQKSYKTYFTMNFIA